MRQLRLRFAAFDPARAAPYAVAALARRHAQRESGVTFLRIRLTCKLQFSAASSAVKVSEIGRNGKRTKMHSPTQLIVASLICAGFLILPHAAFAKQQAFPNFDIARTCQEARTSAGGDKSVAFRGCMNDENEAREQLARRWGQFDAQDRDDCLAQGAAPLPSYVEILTCLEMSELARALVEPESGRKEKLQGPAARQSPKPRQATPSIDLPPLGEPGPQRTR